MDEEAKHLMKTLMRIIIWLPFVIVLGVSLRILEQATEQIVIAPFIMFGAIMLAVIMIMLFRSFVEKWLTKLNA